VIRERLDRALPAALPEARLFDLVNDLIEEKEKTK
jgi:hypothetical protein